jgi:hypothetical protein
MFRPNLGGRDESSFRLYSSLRPVSSLLLVGGQIGRNPGYYIYAATNECNFQVPAISSLVNNEGFSITPM